MKVLQLCHKPPFPVKDGGCLAINQMSNAVMGQDMDLTILSIATPKHPFVAGHFPKGYLKRTRFEAVFVDTRLNVVDAFSNLITSDTYHVSRFFSSDVDKAITGLLQSEKFDFVICESIFVAPYIASIRRLSKAKIILRSHNLEFSIWHRLAKSRPAGLKKTYLKILTKQLRDYEIEMLSQIDGLIAINSDELKHYRRLGYKNRGLTIPFGVNPDEYVPGTAFEKQSVFHLGSMDWKPNEEGIEWFLKKVWPTISKKNPKLTLYLAGRCMPEWLLDLKLKGVKVIGEVDDAQEFMKSKNIMIVPLMSGGGMRVKMIEALALRKPIVSTPLGANGVAVRDEKSVMLARKPSEFAQAILKLSEDPELAENIAGEGRKLVETKYDNEKLAVHLQNFLSSFSE